MEQSSYLLINESPIQILPSLAKLIGLNEAIIVQQIHSWSNNLDTFRDKKWIYINYNEWQKQFPFWSVFKIGNTIKNLQEKNIIFSKINMNRVKFDIENWYSINYEKLKELQSQNK